MLQGMELYRAAHAAGMEAGRKVGVRPMVVGSPSTPFGNDIDPSKPTYFVEGGVCGFAWVNVKPANCKFVNVLKKNGVGRRDGYEGGWTLWVHEFGQSMQRKEAYAGAFADVLRANGVERAYADSRMD